ncbi:MAG TPA: aldo/keto reductase [Candidatus Elarobacter sp.]|nr:aldo/keto reductase [Candidatus Elarobacter sp.]
MERLDGVSALGIGTALGAPDDADDAAYAIALAAALDGGVTLLDTAINYRCQRSERVVGRVLRERAGSNGARGPIVSTKGGYLPLEEPAPASKEEYRAYIQREYIDTGVVAPADLVAGGHCIAPEFLRDQVQRSRRNLQVDTIDLYLLHNPEQQLDGVTRDEFDARLCAAFEALERCVDDGVIAAYGCATWHGLRVSPDAPNALSLETLVRTAHHIAGDGHHFAAVQLPLNLAMTEAVRMQTQTVRGAPRTALEAADELAIAAIAVAPLLQGRLAAGLPSAARDAFPEARSDAECALTFVHMVPRVTSVVVGMRSAEHVRENLALFA